jgi:Zn-dependent peptidase ImmA (M78 family)
MDREYQVWLRSEASTQVTYIEAMEADLFAAERLMPAQFLAKNVRSIGIFDLEVDAIIRGLANRYGVSSRATMFITMYFADINI